MRVLLQTRCRRLGVGARDRRAPGTGYLAFILADAGYRVTGVEIADGMRRVAQKKASEIIGFTNVRIVRLKAIERFERDNQLRDLIWLALTATRPAGEA